VVIRNAINDGTIVGPRYLAASQEITVPGGLGDTTQPHLPQPEFAFGAIVSGCDEMRRCVRMFCKYGVDSLKINLSGESITGMPSEMSQFTEAEIATLRRGGQGLGQAGGGACALVLVDQAVREARHRGDLPRELHRRGRRWTSSRRTRRSTSSRPGWRGSINTLPHAKSWGTLARGDTKMGYYRGSRPHRIDEGVAGAASDLPGGDYGLPGPPHARTRRDLEYFVEHSACAHGGAASATAWGRTDAAMGDVLGQVTRGVPADLCWSTADRWPTSPVLQDKSRILAVMKEGVPSRAAGALRDARPPAGRHEESAMGRTSCSPTSASSTHRHAAVRRQRARAGTTASPRSAAQPRRSRHGATVIDGAGAR
jgi:hypothetical protein